MTVIARAPADGRARRAAIPLAALLIGTAPGARIASAAALAAIARGLQDAGWPEPDICALAPLPLPPRELLKAVQFEPRMRRARAVVIVDRSLDPSTLAGSVTFEIATTARQGGVPAYAVTGDNRLDMFGARMLDLQLIIQARSPAALRQAGRRLGEAL